ncbi:MAG: hypothetical protein IH941_05345 [Acidobacteria bacterium]|nr:hypothetical protein [Acidobacteriota bacterium]
MTDRSVTAALADLGAAIDFPPVPDLDVTFTRLEIHPLGRVAARLRWAVAAGIVAVVALVMLVTPVREAVADWLGIGRTRIVEVDEIPADIEESIQGLGVEVPFGEGLALFGVVDSWPAALGEPDRFFVRIREGRPSELSMVWLPRQDLPEVGSTGIGALFTRFEGTLEAPTVEKSVGEGTSVQLVAVGDAPGYWIGGDAHTFGYLGKDGEVILETLRLAGNTLLWEEGGVSYRFESGLVQEAAITVAETVGN